MTTNKTPAIKRRAKSRPTAKLEPRSRKTPKPKTVEQFRALGIEEVMSCMTDRQLAFALAYDRQGSSIAALHEAYPASIKWSRNTADVRAHELKNTPAIRVFRELMLAERRKSHEDVQDAIVRRMLGILTAKADAVAHFDGVRLHVRPYAEMNEGALGSIKKIRLTDQGTVEVEQHDPKAAASVLMRLLGLEQATDVKHSGAIDLHSLKLETLPDEILEKWAAQYGG